MRHEVSGPLAGARRIAWFSDERPDALFRYRLDVEIGFAEPPCDGPPLAFLCHNPATASHLVDDPSFRRMVGFGRRDGARRVSVVNPVAFRTAKPRELRERFAAGLDIVGTDNRSVVRRVLLDLEADGGRLVLAHGAIAGPAPFRTAMAAAIADIVDEAREMGVPLLCLGTTAAGAPRHPLYLKGSAELRPWAAADAMASRTAA